MCMYVCVLVFVCVCVHTHAFYDKTLQDDDDDDDDEEDTSYLEFAYLIGNTTCRVDSSNTSCYSSFYFDNQYALVSAAFVSHFR